jgi:hypothetical protein
MSNTLNTYVNVPQVRCRAVPPFGNAVKPSSQPALQGPSNQQFIAMLDAFRSSGGLARDQEVAALCKHHGETRLISLAEWIIDRRGISFEWQSKIWFPMFQFDRVDMTLQPGLEESLSELVVAYDDWQIAHWFSLPNPWLADRTPAYTLAAAAPEVRNAARAERYVAAGR